MAEISDEPRFWTEEELNRHDGSDASLPLLLCVQGMIFDVTSAKSFYGPGVLFGTYLPAAAVTTRPRALAKQLLRPPTVHRHAAADGKIAASDCTQSVGCLCSRLIAAHTL
jgi:predicted heme/steroid binding protein